MPQALVEAMDLIQQPEQLEVGPVTEMVQRDPIVVARLIQIVNSAYYGLQRSIDSVDRAVVMLGPVAVTGIVMGMNMLRLRSALEGSASRCFMRLIRHCIATAFLTRHLYDGPPRDYMGKRLKIGRIGTSFTAGLLHDFGKIILVYNYPREAVDLYDRQTFSPQVVETDMRELEQLLFGFDHTEAGEFVARKLDFPDALTDVIRLHHDLSVSTDNPDTDRLIRVAVAANTVSKAMGYSFTTPVDWQACLQHPVWDIILEQDLPHYGTAETIVRELRDQREHLDYYVQHLTATTLAAVHSNAPSKMHRSSPARGV